MVQKQKNLTVLRETFGYHVDNARYFQSIEVAVLYEWMLIQSRGRIEFAVSGEKPILEATGLSTIAFRAARKQLLDLGIISMVRPGGPSSPRIVYTVNTSVFAALFQQWLDEANKLAASTGMVERHIAPQVNVAVPESLFAATFAGGDYRVPAMPGKAPEMGGAELAAQDVSTYAIAEALCEAANIDFALNKGKALALAKLMKAAKLPPSVELIRQNYIGPECWWFKKDWRGKKGQFPTLWTIRDTWGSWYVPGQTVVENDTSDEEILSLGTPGL